MNRFQAAILLFAIQAGSIQAIALDTTADAVVGQANFNMNSPNQPLGSPTASNLSLSNAAHLAIAPNGRLYVADSGNHRVLSWPNTASVSSGDNADMVFGQPDFVSGDFNNGGVHAGSFALPQGVFVDEAGNLWVTDAFNSRVLKFNNPESDATPTLADLVIGQPDFTSNQQNLGNGEHGTNVALPDGLQFPGRLVVRGADVWVADSGNSRVLHYTSPVANKPFADRVFGQYGDFTRRAKNNDGLGENGCCATADNIYNAIGIALDAAGSLFVADMTNNRVLRFDDPVNSDTTADAVIGQPDFISNQFDNGGLAHGLEVPIDIAIDSNGRLFVADSGNNRILVFSTPTLSGVADGVFGQLGSMTTDSINHGLGFFVADADSFFGATGVVVDAVGNVFVADTNNTRVLRFNSPFELSGDMDCNGVLNMVDIEAFSLAIVDENAYHIAYPECDVLRADADENGLLDGRDVQGYVTQFLNGG